MVQARAADETLKIKQEYEWEMGDTWEACLQGLLCFFMAFAGKQELIYRAESLDDDTKDKNYDNSIAT